LAWLDAIVVFSSAQKEFWLQELPTARAIFVPHGVNVTFFRPRSDSASQQDERPRVIFVGTHLRDFQVLAHVVAGAITAHSTLCFDLVIPVDVRTPELLGLGGRWPERIVFHDRVSSSFLLDLYQKAQVALLPLKDATANNSLMEALACGLPVIATDVGGTRDYLSADCGVLVPPEGRELYVKHLMGMIQDAHARARMSGAARARAELFSWETVARQMTQVYWALHSRHAL
jgi:glycosyltransferase involved in cell wall biosynthesis